jgi:8-oxo-dGTP pyrophosphatase MutT (NUDIX family)
MNYPWIEPEEWRRIQRSIPIVCVDILPLRFARAHKNIEAVGLILRDTPRQGRRWCLVGGRVLYGEPLLEAVKRQIRETLGHRAKLSLEPTVQPLYAVEYLPSKGARLPFDPRQHSIGLTYALELRGAPVPTGEAIEYEWVPLEKLRSKQFGFGQDKVVRTCLQLLLNGVARSSASKDQRQ